MSSTERKVRIPVQLIDGHWEFKLGGGVPVPDRTKAELVLERRYVSDEKFLSTLEREAKYKILDEGSILLISLATKDKFPSPESLRHLLVPCSQRKYELGGFDQSKHFGNVFVEVKISGPNAKQSRNYETDRGGLWLITKGLEADGLGSTTIEMPKGIAKERASSINHAYTILSETFEPWRISHTGNIYDQVYYREKNNKWYPLEILRNNALQRAEHETAQQHWKIFLASLAQGRADR